MKVGMNLLLWTVVPSPKEHAPLLKQIKDWGFDGIEIPLFGITDNDLKELAKQCDDLKLGRTAILALGADQADPCNPEAKLRQAALTAIKKAIDQTRLCGADLLCGPFQQGLGRFTGTAPTADEWKRSVEVIRAAGEYAATMHGRLAVEPLNRFEMFLMNTVADAARFCKDVNLANVGMLADTHHTNIEEEKPGEEWAKVVKQIFHVHISENHRGIPGSGHAVTPEIFTALRKGGYDGWLTIEAFGTKVKDLVPRLHIWRAFFKKEDDVATLGLKHIRQGWEKAGK